jgi:hypothetical protein
MLVHGMLVYGMQTAVYGSPVMQLSHAQATFSR